MVLGGIETAVAFGIGVYVAKVIKDTIKRSRAGKQAEKERIAAELKASEPERLAKAAQEEARRVKEYEERKVREAESKKKDEEEALLKAELARKSAIQFSDFEKGYWCPKCGKGWQHVTDTASQPQACNCNKCTGTHFHLTCTGTVTTNKGYSYKTVGCQAKFLMLAKDNKSEGRDRD